MLPATPTEKAMISFSANSASETNLLALLTRRLVSDQFSISPPLNHSAFLRFSSLLAIPWIQVQIDNLQDKRRWVQIGSITQQNYRNSIIGEALDCTAKAHGFAIVPHALMSVVGI